MNQWFPLALPLRLVVPVQRTKKPRRTKNQNSSLDW